MRSGGVRCASAAWYYRYYVVYSLALCVSLLALALKARVIIHKVRKRSRLAGIMMNTEVARAINANFEERRDINKRDFTKSQLALLLACCEVRRCA